jgi:prepilin peptidase CpaA
VVSSAVVRGEGILGHLAAGALALAASYALFSARFVGGGDAKLFAATVLYLGIEHIVAFTLAMSLVGGVMAAGFLLARPRWPSATAELPYGVAIAAAGILTIWSRFPEPP